MLNRESVQQYEKMTGHSLFGPSGAARFIRCPASIQETLKLPPPPQTKYAARGTLLHDFIADITTNSSDPRRAIQRRLDLTERDKEQLQECLDFLDRLALPKGLELTEVEVSLKSFGLPEVYGTADKVWSQAEVVDVLDWKFGIGYVELEENEQMLCYGAASAGYPSTVQLIRLHLAQPALDTFATWECPMKRAVEWVYDVLAPAIQEAMSAEPRYVPGEKQCIFCPARATCRARYNKNQENAVAVFNAYRELPQVKPHEIAEVLHKIAEMETYFKAIRAHAFAEASAGRLPDWKIVRGRSNRKWLNEVTAANFLRKYAGLTNSQIYEPKMIGPAKAEKLARQLKKDEDFARLITKGEGTLNLAPADDPRPAEITGDVADVFGEFADTGE